MLWWWWWAWVVFVIVVLLLPWSYGWGRRGWGPPYPTYYRRARGRNGTVAPEPADTDPYDPTVPPMRDRTAVGGEPVAPARRPGDGWRWLADLLWLGVLAAIAWAVYLWVT